MSYIKHIKQEVEADAGNSSTTNLTSASSPVAYEFTGVSKSTLGVNGLQWSLKTDQNATVCVEESDDETNWDIAYCFDYIASKGGRGETVQATKAFWRLVVTLTGTEDTTYFRLGAVLCPIAVPLPSNLSADGRLKVEAHIVGETDRHVWVNPTNELNISPVPRLVGTAFEGATIDTHFWTPTITNAGTVAQTNGIMTLRTNTTTGATTKLVSGRRARFVAGSAMRFASGMMSTTPYAGNTKRVGPYDDDNGFFYQMVNTTFSVGTRINTTDTLVNSGSFNGSLGATFTPTTGTYYKLDIEYNPLGVFFYINGKLLHSIMSAGLSGTMTLPITMENNNTAVDDDTSFNSMGAYIARYGELTTAPTTEYSSGTQAEVICKRGAGVIRGLVLGDITAGSIITLFDGLVATGTEIWSSGSSERKAVPFDIDFYNTPFNIGLSYSVTSAASNITIVYE